MNINVPQVQLINPENQIVEVRYTPMTPASSFSGSH